jgi:hypothetical protein
MAAKKKRSSRGPTTQRSRHGNASSTVALTEPQRQGVEDIAQYGYVRGKGMFGAAASRMTGRLIRMGLAESIGGAEWKLTPLGQRARWDAFYDR